MPNSVLDAIKQGIWDFEPTETATRDYQETGAMPGTEAKLEILARRVQDGLPLWHPNDRKTYDDAEQFD